MNDYAGRGFVQIMRSVQNTKSYDNMTAMGVYVHCLMWATYQPKQVKGKLLSRGQFITSNKKLADECGLSESQMRRVLNALKRDELIVIETSKQKSNKPSNEPSINGMVITVVNYGVSGPSESKSDEQTDEQTSDQTDKRTVNNKKRTSKTEEYQGFRECATQEGDPSRIAEYLESNGFEYTGKASLISLLIDKHKSLSYPELESIAHNFVKEKEKNRKRIRNHVAYFLTMIDEYMMRDCQEDG